MDHCLLLERRPRLVAAAWHATFVVCSRKPASKDLLKGWSLPARDAIGYLLTVNY
jgi:hypothetical protein